MVAGLRFAGLALLCLALPALAQNEFPKEGERQITLEELFRAAERGNPEIAAARSVVDARAGRARQSGAYPNPTIEFEVEDMLIDDSDHRAELVTLAQPIVIAGRRGNAAASARADREAAEHLLEQTRRDVLLRVHSTWAELLYLRDASLVLSGLNQTAKRTHEIAETRFEVRAAPEIHRTKALLELYELETMELRLNRGRAKADAEMTALMGGTPVPMNKLIGTLDSGDLDIESLGDGIAQHPAARAAESDVAAAEAALSAAKSERIPDLEIFASYGRDRPSDERFLGAGLSLPLPIFDRGGGNVAEHRARVIEAESNKQAADSELRVAYTAARANYEAVRRELRVSIEQLEPAAHRAVEQAQEGYRVGRVPFLDLLDAQRTISDVRLGNLELKRDLVIAEAVLMSLAGIGPYGDTGATQ